MADWYIPPLQTLFPDVQWYGSGQTVCLTFDDGPHPAATPAVLDILRSHSIKATFFLLGQNVQRYPDLARKIDQEGHTIGNHTQTHRRIWFSRRDVLEGEIGGCQDALREATGSAAKLFRPPYGLFDPMAVRAVARMGLQTVLFSINSWDFAEVSNARIVERTTRSVRPGEILVLHDNDKTAGRISDYLPAIISQLQDQGLSFGPL